MRLNGQNLALCIAASNRFASHAFSFRLLILRSLLGIRSLPEGGRSDCANECCIGKLVG